MSEAIWVALIPSVCSLIVIVTGTSRVRTNKIEELQHKHDIAIQKLKTEIHYIKGMIDDIPETLKTHAEVMELKVQLTERTDLQKALQPLKDDIEFLRAKKQDKNS